MSLEQPGTATTWPSILDHLLRGQDLAPAQAAWVMDVTMSGQAPPAALGAFLVALKAKGESVAEMRGLSDMMLRHAEPYGAAGDVSALDVVGTGGDGHGTVNISTMSAIVAAGAGVPVVKHGNRAASSNSGSADVLEVLGVRLDLSPARVAQIVDLCGITFCFAQAFHPSMRHAGPTRRELGIRTAFNFLGPLSNPARPRYSAVGVGEAAMAPIIAGVFADRGQHAVIFRGDDGLDEVSPATTSSVWWVLDGRISRFSVDPRRVGFDFSPVQALRGQGPEFNADVVRSVCRGEPGPVREAVLLNTGLALALTAGVEPGTPATTPSDEAELHDRWAAGIAAARACLDEGRAAEVLDTWVRATQA